MSSFGTYWVHKAARQIVATSEPDKSASVDDFLHRYRPQLSHVQEFLVCSADPFDPPSTGFHAQAIQASKQAAFVLEQSEQSCAGSVKPSHLGFARLSRSMDRDPAPMLKSSVLGNHDVTYVVLGPQTARISKQASDQLTESGKAERRRDQNREAQRRFRERQMYLGR